MKKIFTTALLMMLGAGAYAQTAPQTAQGTMVVSGSVSLSNSSSESTSDPSGNKSIYRSIYLNPTVGYLIKDGLEIGTGVGLRQYNDITKMEEGKNVTRTNTVSLIPYVRKYIALTEHLQLHGTAYASFGIGNRSAKGYQDSSSKVMSTHNSLGIGVYPGLTYFATPRLGFTAVFGSLAYGSSREKATEDASTDWSRSSSYFNADFSPSSIGIGFSYFIAR